MAKHKFALRKSFVGSIVLGAACLLAIGVWLTSFSHFTEAQATRVKQNIIINNRTQTLQITKAERDGKNLRLEVKNGSHKNLDWFRISFGRNESIEADFAFADPPVLAPGETYEDLYAIESDSPELNIIVVSVLFEDRTSDGDVSYARTIKEKRAGQKTQLKRLLPLLQKAINAPADKGAAALTALETEVSGIQDEHDKTMSEARRIGLRNAKERILHEVQKIKDLRERDKGKDVRQDLIPVKERYEKILTKLEGYAS